jgi:hypothetical protein
MATKKTAATKAKTPVKKSATKKAAVPKKLPGKPDSGITSKQAARKQKKEHKVKVVRDSFTMPRNEYQKIAEIKAICLKSKLQVKKSEVLRAGLKVLVKLNAAQLKNVLSGLEKIKTGRPKKP